MSRRYYSSNAADTTLSGTITSGATSITVGSITGHPVQYPYTLVLDPETSSEEVVEVTSGTGTNLTVTRGVDGTTALAHTAGAVVRHGVSARDYDEPNAHVNSSTGVHSVSGALVGTSDTQTLTGKTISVDDNDISGLAASSFVRSDASGVIDGSAAAKAVPTGTVVGTTDAQELTNKTVDLTDNTVTGTKAEFDAAVSDGNLAFADANDADWAAWAGMDLYFSGGISTTTKGGSYKRRNGLLTGHSWADQDDNGPTFGGSSTSIQVSVPVTPDLLGDTSGAREWPVLGTWAYLNSTGVVIASGVLVYDAGTGRANCAVSDGNATAGSSFRNILHANWNYRVAE